eukprot:COSAG06_NODE_14689_length_1135_cov_1.038610_1_plen_170_part_10
MVTTVEGSLKGGELQSLTVTPGANRHLIHVRNCSSRLKTDDADDHHWRLMTDDERIQSPSVLPIVSPLATLFSSKEPSHGAPASIENYGNTLSLLLLPPQLGDNSTILIAATRGNVNKVSNVPVLRRSSDGGVSFGTVILPVGVPAPGVSWQQVTQAYDAVANRLIVVLG